MTLINHGDGFVLSLTPQEAADLKDELAEISEAQRRGRVDVSADWPVAEALLSALRGLA